MDATTDVTAAAAARLLCLCVSDFPVISVFYFSFSLLFIVVLHRCCCCCYVMYIHDGSTAVNAVATR